MLSNAVKELRLRKKQIASQIKSLESESKRLDLAITALTDVVYTRAVLAPAKTAKKKGPSAAGIARIKAAQKARWAKIRGKNVAKSAKRRKMSAAGRKAIAAAKKAWWAAKKKAARKK